jgi:hypothetical protein
MERRRTTNGPCTENWALLWAQGFHPSWSSRNTLNRDRSCLPTCLALQICKWWQTDGRARGRTETETFFFFFERERDRGRTRWAESKSILRWRNELLVLLIFVPLLSDLFYFGPPYFVFKFPDLGSLRGIHLII